jgi:hypothetical protein
VSTIAVEEDALTDWLIDYLEADTTLMSYCNGLVSPDVVWETNVSPFVRVDRLDGTDVMVIGLHRVWADTTYHIRGVYHWRGSGRPDRTDVNAIGARLDTLLHNHEVLTGTWQIHSFREEAEPTPSVFEPNGELWLQSGGVYRLRISAL